MRQVRQGPIFGKRLNDDLLPYAAYDKLLFHINLSSCCRISRLFVSARIPCSGSAELAEVLSKQSEDFSAFRGLRFRGCGELHLSRISLIFWESSFMLKGF
jgi:hypothetical protein